MSTANATYAQAKAILSMLNQGTKKGSMYPAAWQLMKNTLEANIFSDDAIRELQGLVTVQEASDIISGLLKNNDKPLFNKFEVTR
jgi:hypothetical protein